VIVLGYPHYVTQHGNSRQPTLFCHDDCTDDLALMVEWCETRGVEV